MATNVAQIAPDGLRARPVRGLSFERRFFLTAAVLFPLITIIGFAPTYYLKPAFDRPPIASAVVHFHAAVMTLWMMLYVGQTLLISARKVRLHMKLGWVSVGLAAVIIPTGFYTAYEAMLRGGTMPGFTPGEFLIIPVVDMIVFPILFAAAIYYRKQPANHKRLMLVTAINFLPPSLARMPFALQYGALWYAGVPILLGLIALGIDTWKNRRFNLAFVAGLALMIVSGPARMAFAKTDTWHSFTDWLARLS
jgi:hypothetical protein